MLLSDFFEAVNKHKEKNLPFAFFKKPNENNISGYFQLTDTLYKNTDFSESGFIFSPFEGEDKEHILLPEKYCNILTSTINETFIYHKKESLKKETQQLEANKKYLHTIGKALKLLRLGELSKVVISRAEIVEITKNDPIKWFYKMAYLYPNTFNYCWYHPKVGMWLGASPEVLISVKKNSFTTMALAGTMPYKGTLNVKWGEKEKEEQQMVVDSILKALKPITLNISKNKTQTHRAGSLLHLRTIIKGQLKPPKKLKELINTLHPTSAICGIPILKAKKFILNNESYDRGYYTGYLGAYKKEGDTSLFVNLRCMEVSDKIVKIYVGGGITALSNAELEWEETVNKSKIIKAIL